MNRMTATLLALAGLATPMSAVLAHDHVIYHPYGWYEPRGSYWVRWHGYREVWTPPSATGWSVVRVPCGNPSCLPPAVQLPFELLPSVPAEPMQKTWTYGKRSTSLPVIQQLLPDPGPCPSGP
jgi:hypothetical protein